MIECELTTRKWGNSLGATFPKDVVEQAKLREDQVVKILIVKQGLVLKKTFGMIKGELRKPAQEIKDELREELHAR